MPLRCAKKAKLIDHAGGAFIAFKNTFKQPIGMSRVEQDEWCKEIGRKWRESCPAVKEQYRAAAAVRKYSKQEAGDDVKEAKSALSRGLSTLCRRSEAKVGRCQQSVWSASSRKRLGLVTETQSLG